MNKSEAAAILSRRLGLNIGRVNALLVAASDAGVLPKARGRDVPSLSSLDIAHLILTATCDKGIGVVVVSTEPETVLSLADRIVVMKRGTIVREFAGDTVSKDRLLEAA